MNSELSGWLSGRIGGNWCVGHYYASDRYWHYMTFLCRCAVKRYFIWPILMFARYEEIANIVRLKPSRNITILQLYIVYYYCKVIIIYFLFCIICIYCILCHLPHLFWWLKICLCLQPILYTIYIWVWY